MKPIGGILLFVFSLFLLTPFNTDAASKTSIKIIRPIDKSTVGKDIVVKGKATISGGHYIWVIARQIDYKPLWWPQKEADFDPSSGEWEANAVLGKPNQDTGKKFDVGVIVVDRGAHAKLKKYWINAMQTGDWKPIQIPSTVVAPDIVTVIRN